MHDYVQVNRILAHDLGQLRTAADSDAARRSAWRGASVWHLSLAATWPRIPGACRVFLLRPSSSIMEEVWKSNGNGEKAEDVLCAIDACLLDGLPHPTHTG